jgi:hypothetical protein
MASCPILLRPPGAFALNQSVFAKGTVMNSGKSPFGGVMLFARLLLASTFVFGMAAVHAEIFNE